MFYREITGSVDSPWVKPDGGDFRFLIDRSTPQKYRAGAMIYNQGDLSDGFYYLEEGKVKVFIIREDGSEKSLGFFESGTLFGESGCIDAFPYFASAIALQDSLIYKINREALLQAISERPEVAFLIMSSLVRKIRLLAFQVEGLSLLDSFSRTCSMLKRIANDYGVTTPKGKMLGMKVTGNELGNMVGASRVTISKIINHLQREGVIRRQGQKIIIVDEAKLDKYASGKKDTG